MTLYNFLLSPALPKNVGESFLQTFTNRRFQNCVGKLSMHKIYLMARIRSLLLYDFDAQAFHLTCGNTVV